MQSYLNHLISDLRSAATQLRTELAPIRQFESVEEHFAAIEAFLHVPQYDFEYWTDISQDELPVVERLTEDQCELLVEELTHLWAALKISISFPEETTIRTRYNAIRLSWKDPCSVGIEGMVWDFCDGFAPDCPLGKECPCWEFWEDG